ncbi:DUF659 domain-containing protein [Aphis craccivora]|uniref:DUF659 domain-containing protein n=1 Tax=Aphis craccivora TaxID=307492 RepID=A0A6G0VPR3_APHCR|nr:DUF659 domain-containing protein [Aphis craccivora]
MSKIRKNIKCLINQWIEPYNKDTIVFTTDGNVVYCQVCNRQVPCNKKFQITQHVHTSFHSDSLKRSINNKKQMLLGNVYKSKTNNFNEDLCLSLVAANIPWFKLQVPQFRDFLQKYTNQHIPDESLLRKSYLESCYNKTIENIREKVGDSYIFLIVDETTDINGNYIANLLIGALSSENSCNPFLIASKKLEKTNHSTIARFVNDGLRILWPNGGNNEKVLLLLSDAAPYMIKAALPPEPILTRWGTWIEAATFCADNFEQLKIIIIEKLKEKNVVSIKKCEDMLKLESVKTDLTYIKTNFFILVKSIKKLESSNLSLFDATKIVDETILNMKMVSGNNGRIIKEKVSDLIHKNGGFQILKQISDVLSGKKECYLPPNFTPMMSTCMKYAPITSVDVERSFSTYKMILTEKRTNMTPQNMEMYIVINCYENKK